MKVVWPLLGLGVGLLALSGRESAPQPSPGIPGTTPFGPPPEPDSPPEPPPRIVFVPPLTVPPNGRHLSAAEKLSLSPFVVPKGLEQRDIDDAILWWGSPESSFASEDSGAHIIALTTARGIYLRGQNHEITRHDELATLGHELMHVGQYRRGDVGRLTKAELELPAYQMGLAIRQYLDDPTGKNREWNA